MANETEKTEENLNYAFKSNKEIYDKIFQRFNISRKTHFSGSSPPEIFVGRFGYPFVNAGILSPEEYGDTEEMSLPELWHERDFDISRIISLRGKLIYGRFKTNVKGLQQERRFVGLMKEISLATKPVSVEVFLKKAPKASFNVDSHMPIIGNPAPLEKARIEENIKTEKKIEYLTGDTNVKAVEAVKEMYKGNVKVSNIMKVLSAGLLGRKLVRKLVPTRWSITAVDDSLSKHLLGKIRFYPEISEIIVFNSYYLGNHYEFLLLPDKFSFEVIEAKMPSSVWNPSEQLYLAIDYEGFNGRKSYAGNVTGAYYANRLAFAEYLEKIKRQASCLVMRECRPEYYAPCGVGILREASRAAFREKPERFPSIETALESIGKRLKLPVSVFGKNSLVLKEHKKQTRLVNWI